MLEPIPVKDYYGVTHSTQEVAGLKLAEREYAAFLQTPAHTHSTAHISFVLAGGFKQTYGSKSRVQQRLTTAFYSPQKSQSETFFAEGCRLFNVELDSAWYRRFRQYGVIAEDPVEFNAGSIALLMSKIVDESQALDDLSPLVVEGLLLEIIGEASRKFRAYQTSRTSWLTLARDILHDHFAENLSISQIAALVEVHPVRLATAFRQQYRCTIGDYRRRLRIEFACRELANTRWSLTEVALAAGFADQAHFSRTFKRLTGTTPAKFRSGSIR
ncbi:MAG TPA: AraC family transcriptional regulator [Pyrinomonadaceae bacterium]|nr:AraC family transcriptional regulator [Pyrinomonadaceae bacterium]